MSLQAKFDNLEEREKKLALAFGGVCVVMVLVVVPLLVRLGVSEQADQNQAIKDVIQEIVDERVTLGRKQAERGRVDSRYGRPAPALAGFLAQTADRVSIEIPESQDRSTVPHGKQFKERATRIRLKKVGLLALTNFMENLVGSGYPIAITRLDIKKRDSKPDEYDVEMDVSAYDREEKKPVKKPKPQDDAAAGDAADEDEE